MRINAPTKDENQPRQGELNTAPQPIKSVEETNLEHDSIFQTKLAYLQNAYGTQPLAQQAEIQTEKGMPGGEQDTDQPQAVFGMELDMDQMKQVDKLRALKKQKLLHEGNALLAS